VDVRVQAQGRRHLVYVKLMLRPGCVVVSFQEDEDGDDDKGE
jgi:hypothetical protein